MDNRFSLRFWDSHSENRKSKIQNRKFFIVMGAFLFGLSYTAEAQTQARVGILGPEEEPRFSELAGGLKEGLRDHGYSQEGLQIVEGRVPRGDRTGARAATEKMVRQNPNILFVIGSELAKTVRQVSSDIPVVFITPGDPVGAGLVSSLARPGGNMTAMTFEYPELTGKRLELLKEMVPKLRRVVALYDPRDASPRQGAMAARESAPQLGIALVERETRSREQISSALDTLVAGDALLAIPGGLTSAYYEKMIHAANAKRLATMFHSRSGSTMEALATYGANDTEIARQAARLVDKILKGIKAGELPVERPTKLAFIINLKTAKQIGITIPPNVLARADRVIK